MSADHDELDPALAQAVAALRNAPPPADLWPGIAQRLRPRRPRGTVVMAWPVALAAGLVLAALGAGGALLWRRAAVPAPIASTQRLAATQPRGPRSMDAAYSAADTTLLAAIGDLEQAVRAAMAQLSPQAQAGVARSLTAVDGAIAQARAERRAAPADPEAARYLTAMLRKKLDVLQTISRLTADRS